MEDQIISAQDSTSAENKGPQGVNKVLLGIIFVLVLVIIGGGAYFFGSQSSGQSGNVSPTPASTLKTLGEQAPTPTETPTSTESGTMKEETTPTPKVSVTPKPTSKDLNLKLKPTATPTQSPPTTPPPNLQF